MKNKFIALAIVCTAVLNFNGCGKSGEVNEKADVVSTSSSSSKIDEEKVVEMAEEKPVDSNETKQETNVKKIGMDDYGFIEVPANWVEFRDVDLSNNSPVIQYSDPLGKSIISLNTFENNVNKLEDLAQAYGQNIQNDGVKVTGAKVKIANYDAYQLYGCYENEGIVLVIWLFRDEDNMVHYISAESSLDKITDVVKYVEGTYALH